jgi:hypothetical protein
MSRSGRSFPIRRMPLGNRSLSFSGGDKRCRNGDARGRKQLTLAEFEAVLVVGSVHGSSLPAAPLSSLRYNRLVQGPESRPPAEKFKP